jgi:tetratricopeptide (TPR) repeat protein
MEEEPPSLVLGSRLLNSGKTIEALVCLLEVRDEHRQANNGRSRPTIEQQLGICYRLLGRHERANQAFRTAFLLSKDKVRRGCIKRDWAMVSLASKEFETAHAVLDEAFALIAQSDRLEYAATMGFKARVYASQGDKSRADDFYRAADGMIQRGDGNDNRKATYELNNLVWWLKVAKGPRNRRNLAARAWKLADAAGHQGRKVQIASLLICRPLTVRIAG